MNSFISHSQNLEDLVLRRLFSDVDAGFYIDIGAWHFERDSVTKSFYDLGWRGINVEPTPKYWSLLCKHRPRDLNLRLAVSDKANFVTFNQVDGSGLSSIEQDASVLGKRLGFNVKAIAVETQTLTQVIAQHCPKDQTIHFLKIDVEGHERKVLEGMDWTRFRPVVVLIEAVHATTREPVWDEWEQLILRANYQLIYFDGLNRYYLRNESAYLADRIRIPLNLFDGFLLSRNHQLVLPFRSALKLKVEGLLPRSLAHRLVTFAKAVLSLGKR